MSGDTDSALMMYLHLGELGIEVAQCNAAFMLEEGTTLEFVYIVIPFSLIRGDRHVE